MELVDEELTPMKYKEPKDVQEMEGRHFLRPSKDNWQGYFLSVLGGLGIFLENSKMGKCRNSLFHREQEKPMWH